MAGIEDTLIREHVPRWTSVWPVAVSRIINRVLQVLFGLIKRNTLCERAEIVAWWESYFLRKIWKLLAVPKRTADPGNFLTDRNRRFAIETRCSRDTKLCQFIRSPYIPPYIFLFNCLRLRIVRIRRTSPVYLLLRESHQKFFVRLRPHGSVNLHARNVAGNDQFFRQERLPKTTRCFVFSRPPYVHTYFRWNGRKSVLKTRVLATKTGNL